MRKVRDRERPTKSPVVDKDAIAYEVMGYLIRCQKIPSRTKRAFEEAFPKMLDENATHYSTKDIDEMLVSQWEAIKRWE